ncbi:hypothetical protein LJB88_02115 [Erysipelotrichaceae bacterium OttesenSCG-928-M19]|nr:hypothetical protein [Erysipelotrichaceae bacterium OttesenSCG-928-M19]
MGNTVGDAYVQIKPQTKGIGNEIEKGIQQETSGTGGVVGTAIGTALGAGIFTAAKAGLSKLTGFMKTSIMEGADLEQQLGGASAVFEKHADKLVETSKSAYKDMGLSQNDFLQGANKMGSLFQGAGHDVASSLKMSQDYMLRASDVASIMGIDTSEALDAVTAAAKGNFTMMDNLGVAMNATTLEAYALEQGINKSWNSMSNQEKTGLAYQMFMEKTSKYAGNYAKENETLSGSLNTVRKGFATLMGQLANGDDISKTLEGMKEPMMNLANSIVDAIKNIAPQIGLLMKEIAPVISQAISELAPVVIPALITVLGQIASGIIESIPSILSGIGGAFLDADIGGKIGLAIVGSFAAFGLAKKLSPLISTAINSIKVPAVPTGGGAGFGGFMTSLANGISAFANPKILLGAVVIAGTMAILSAGVWASIKIVSNALPDLGNALNSFNEIDGGNLAKTGLGLVALGAGLLAMTAGGIVDGLSKWLGFGGFGDTLKSIIEPIAEILPTIDANQLEKFSLLSTGLGTLATGFESIKDLGTVGETLATAITSIRDAVSKFTEVDPSAMSAVTTMLTGISTAIVGFASVNGENIGLIGTGLVNLAEGVKTLSTLDPAAVGLVGQSLQQLIEPLSLAMTSLSPETITMFTNLSTAMMNLGNAGEGLSQLGSVGTSVSNAINEIKTAVENATAIGMEPYTNLNSQMTSLKTALQNLSTVQLNQSPIVSFLNDVSNKIKTLNDFDWSSAAAKMKTQGQEIGKQIVAGIVSGINNNAYTLNIAISDKIDAMVKAAVKKAEIHSPSALFEREVGYWLGAALPSGFEKGVEDYTPNSIDAMKASLSKYETNTETISNSFPSTFKIIDDDGFVLRIKAVVDEKIIKNNINTGLITR